MLLILQPLDEAALGRLSRPTVDLASSFFHHPLASTQAFKAAALTNLGVQDRAEGPVDAVSGDGSIRVIGA